MSHARVASGAADWLAALMVAIPKIGDPADCSVLKTAAIPVLRSKGRSH
jgi:hypothetical protein